LFKPGKLLIIVKATLRVLIVEPIWWPCFGIYCTVLKRKTEQQL